MPENMIDVLVHFVWATWDRLPLITEAYERDIHRSIAGISEQHGCRVMGIGGTENHVHLLISMSNTITIAKLMESVKGGSSRYVNEVLRSSEWFKWQGSYGAFSVGPTEKTRIIDYLNHQKQHHADGSTWADAEMTGRSYDKDKPHA